MIQVKALAWYLFMLLLAKHTCEHKVKSQQMLIGWTIYGRFLGNYKGPQRREDSYHQTQAVGCFGKHVGFLYLWAILPAFQASQTGAQLRLANLYNSPLPKWGRAQLRYDFLDGR